MKLSLLPLLILIISSSPTFAEDKPGPFQREVEDSWSFTNVEEALSNIQQKSGFKVSCPPEVITYLHQLQKQTEDNRKGRITFFPGGFSGSKHDPATYDAGPLKGHAKTVPLSQWLDNFCKWQLGATWKFNSEKNEIELAVPWKKSDPRSAAELLDYIEKNSWIITHHNNRFVSEDNFHDLQAAFDALLSKDANYPKAMPVRQRADHQSTCFDWLRVLPITSISGEKYTLFIGDHPSGTIPGADYVTYYWFTRDGTLAGADFMATSTVTHFSDAEVDAAEDSKNGATELQVIYKGTQERDGSRYLIARFILDGHTLKLTHLTNARGQELPNNAGIGRSFLPATAP